jgi:hypothetical protein
VLAYQEVRWSSGTALGLPEAMVRKAVASMKKRIKAVYEAKGKDIARD